MQGDLPHYRIFISSPGDVAEERRRAVAVVGQVQRYVQGRCVLEPYVWERAPMLHAKDFQEAIHPPRDCDVVVLVLWSRLGTPLPEKYRAETGHLPTGTEWEFLDAKAGHEADGTPDLLVYRRTDSPRIDLDEDEASILGARAQRQAVASFFEQWFKSADGSAFTASFSPYERPDEFGQLLAEHLVALIDKKLGEGTGVVTWRGSPFKGLMAFQYDDAPIFFGRSRATHELLQHLSDQLTRGVAFVLVLGSSGSGKSSLVRAGLLPMP